MRPSARIRRLCMVVHGPYPVGEPRVERQAQAVLERGWDVDVVCMRRAGESRRETVDGVAVIRLPLSHRRGAGGLGVAGEYVGFAFLATLAVAKLMRRRRYDVVQIHNPPDFLIVAALAPKLMGARVVFDVHDLSPAMFAMRFGGFPARVACPLLERIERLAIRSADAVLTVHEQYRGELERNVSAGPIHVVMNTIDERLLPATPSGGPNGFRVTYHGTVTPSYGLELLVDAFARLVPFVPDARLEIYGEGDAVESTRACADRLEVGDRVALTGEYLPHREVLTRVAKASVGVIPNLPTPLNRFALSSKLFEYVALRVPVVCSGLPTLRSHFSEDEVLFFEPGDPASLSDALLAVSRNPEAAAQRADAAALRYDEEYRWARQADRYVSVLSSLACR